MTRAENAARAAALKAEGLNGIQIAVRMGISRSYAYELLADPVGEEARARKAKFCGCCIDCGDAISYGTGGPPERCRPCANGQRRRWTHETVVAALHRWNELHGRPPGAHHWFTAPSPDYPAASSVVEVFGTWNAAIVAAGFIPLTRGHKRTELLAA